MSEAADMDEGRRRRVIVLTARVHPGETPSSFVMQGVIDFLCSSHPNAVALRRAATFVLVPMLNPDGVALGNYRSAQGAQPAGTKWPRREVRHTTFRPTCSVFRIGSSPLHPLLSPGQDGCHGGGPQPPLEPPIRRA